MQEQIQQVRLQVEGMGCGGCAVKIEKLLRQVDGVQDAAVSFPNREAMVTYEAAVTDPEALVTRLTEAGYLVSSGGLLGTPAG